MRLAAYGLAGPLLLLAVLTAFSGGGQVVIRPGDCRVKSIGELIVYYAEVPVEATVPAAVSVKQTVFAPPGKILVEVNGEAIEPPARLALAPGEKITITVYCAGEVARGRAAPLAIVEAGIEPWFTVSLLVVLALVLGVVAGGLQPLGRKSYQEV